MADYNDSSPWIEKILCSGLDFNFCHLPTSQVRVLNSDQIPHQMLCGCMCNILFDVCMGIILIIQYVQIPCKMEKLSWQEHKTKVAASVLYFQKMTGLYKNRLTPQPHAYDPLVS